jgi:hypothetical protein
MGNEDVSACAKTRDDDAEISPKSRIQKSLILLPRGKSHQPVRRLRLVHILDGIADRRANAHTAAARHVPRLHWRGLRSSDSADARGRVLNVASLLSFP